MAIEERKGLQASGAGPLPSMNVTVRIMEGVGLLQPEVIVSTNSPALSHTPVGYENVSFSDSERSVSFVNVNPTYMTPTRYSFNLSRGRFDILWVDGGALKSRPMTLADRKVGLGHLSERVDKTKIPFHR